MQSMWKVKSLHQKWQMSGLAQGCCPVSSLQMHAVHEGFAASRYLYLLLPPVVLCCYLWGLQASTPFSSCMGYSVLQEHVALSVQKLPGPVPPYEWSDLNIILPNQLVSEGLQSDLAAENATCSSALGALARSGTLLIGPWEKIS